MINLFSNNYLARNPIEKEMKNFSKNFTPNQKVIDIGCGNKPYAKYFNCKYIGVDPFPNTSPDIVADAWNIPISNESFDGVILNQSLEHIKKTKETIEEIYRILKPGGLGIVTVPQAMKNHSIPIPSKQIKLNNFNKNEILYFNNDYFRFTKFGLIYLFKKFKIIKIQESSGYFGTIAQLLNYFFCALKPIDKLFIPFYFVLNIIGYSVDIFFRMFSKINCPFYRKFYTLNYLSLPLNYILIIKK